MLSLPHLVVLFVIALVIFGPQKLPELARMLGKATAEFRKMTNDFRYALEDEVRESRTPDAHTRGGNGSGGSGCATACESACYGDSSRRLRAARDAGPGCILACRRASVRISVRTSERGDCSARLRFRIDSTAFGNSKRPTREIF